MKVKATNEFGDHRTGSSTIFFVLIFVAGLVVGGMVTAYLTYQQSSQLKSDIANLESQISRITGNQTVIYQPNTIYQNGIDLVELYANVKDSVVLVRGTTSSGAVQGSGFVYNFSNTMVVITNYHVVHGTSSLSVTFSSGNGSKATIIGTDPYADLAVLNVNAPTSEFKPIQIVSSSTLKVGEPVIAIGNPYGLVGSMTTGEISALGRTITEDQYTGGYAIANIIQTSTPINPGNSGGPLLNYLGRVVGITTAIVENSQGVGFAIPSNTILKEIFAIVNYGHYDAHSYLGVSGISMDYDLAQQYGVNVTYGWRIADVTLYGPAYNASIRSGDIIVGINGTIVRNGDEMTSYFEENTAPKETVILTIIRNNLPIEKAVVLGTRPAPP